MNIKRNTTMNYIHIFGGRPRVFMDEIRLYPLNVYIAYM